MDYDTEVMGRIIRDQREARSLSQTVLADFAEISRSHLSDIENGRKSPNISTLWRIAVAMEMKPSELMRLAEDRSSI